MFTSIISSKELVFDDNPATISQKKIGRRGLFKRDYNKVPLGSLSYLSNFNLPLIPEEEYDERIEELEKTKTNLSSIAKANNLKCKNQASTNFCWNFGPVGAMEVLNVKEGNPYIELSPANVGSLITGFRNVGGWGTDSLEFIIKNGVCSTKFWPEATISRKYNTEEAKENALKHKVIEWTELAPRNLRQLFTCLLSRIPVTVGYNWWRHQIYLTDVVIIKKGVYGVRGRNSWGSTFGDDGYFVLQGSKMLPDDAIAPRVITPSND